MLDALRETQGRVEARLIDSCTERFGDWSAKDLLCHLAVWQRIAGAKLAAKREGREATASEMVGEELDEETSKRLWDMPIDPTNAWFFEHFKDWDWKRAHAYWAGSSEFVNGEVERLTEADFEADEKLWDRIGVDTYTHVREHLGR